MNQPSFTPGPWRAVGCAVDSAYDCVADVYHVNSEANAQLIASAPDLFIALDEARRNLGLQHVKPEVFDLIDKALARAMGEQS